MNGTLLTPDSAHTTKTTTGTSDLSRRKPAVSAVEDLALCPLISLLISLLSTQQRPHSTPALRQPCPQVISRPRHHLMSPLTNPLSTQPVFHLTSLLYLQHVNVMITWSMVSTLGMMQEAPSTLVPGIKETQSDSVITMAI